MSMPSPNRFNPLRFTILLCLLTGCTQPVMPSQGSSPAPMAQPAASASPALQAVPADLSGEWIETQQPIVPAEKESYAAFRARILAQLEQGSLSLSAVGPDKASAREYPYASFFNGRAPVLRLGQRTYSWNDFRAPMPGTSQQPGEIGFDGRHLAVPASEHSLAYAYYVSKAHDQLVFLPLTQADFFGRLTVYLREADAKARYGMCLNPAEGNAIGCEELD